MLPNDVAGSERPEKREREIEGEIEWVSEQRGGRWRPIDGKTQRGAPLGKRFGGRTNRPEPVVSRPSTQKSRPVRRAQHCRRRFFRVTVVSFFFFFLSFFSIYLIYIILYCSHPSTEIETGIVCGRVTKF